MDAAVIVENADRSGDDRAAAFSQPDRCLVVVADGAGGVAGGARAAQAVVDRASQLDISVEHDWVGLLRMLDHAVAADADAGETTAVVALITCDTVVGASVGDSEAWLLTDDLVTLTEHQRRKPLLGSGAAAPVAFASARFGRRVLLASDGLFKYVPAPRIRDLSRRAPLHEAARNLVDAACLPNGKLQDDVALILAG